MNIKQKGSTWFLRGVLLLMAVIALLIGIFAVPSMVQGIGAEFPTAAHITYLFFIAAYGAAVPFFIALYQSLKLLNYIDKDIAFSEASVQALKNIKYAAIGVCLFFAVNMPLCFRVAQDDDAPGLIIIGMIIVCSPLVIAVFAALLQKLLKNAIDIQAENELTV